LDDTIQYIDNFLYLKSLEITDEEKSTLISTRDNLIDTKNQIDIFTNFLSIDNAKIEIYVIPINIGIALNNTFVTQDEDYIGCVPIKLSDDSDIDLGILQTKSKTLPNGVTNIFDFVDHNPNISQGTYEKGDEWNVDKPLKIDTKVYMIGYNYGKRLADTHDGIKAQLTEGIISQESDGSKVLYSIPSLPGSSGSPIINEWGNLVAINYAGIKETQNFNFGILSKHLHKLLNQ